MPYYRRNLFILSSTIFLASLSWQQVVPFLPPFLEELGAGANLLLWSALVTAAHPVAGIIAQPFWGKMGDSHGRKPMIIRAGVFLTCVYFGMSVCQTPWQLVTLRFLNGALTGFIPGSFALIATNTPEEHAPRAVATAQAASAAGLILGPFLGGTLADLTGYRQAMQVSGTAVFLSTLLVLWLVKEPNKVLVTEKTSLLQDFKTAVKSPILQSVMFALMLATFFGSTLAFISALYLKYLGGENLPDKIIGLVFALPAVAFVLSVRRWTYFGERRGFHRVITISLIGGGIGSMMLGFAPSVLVFGILLFAVGLVLAGIQPAVGAITCTQVVENFRGRAYGMQQSAQMLGGVAAPILGAQVGKLFGMRAIFVFAGLVFVSGFFVFKRMVKRWKTHATEVDIVR